MIGRRRFLLAAFGASISASPAMASHGRRALVIRDNAMFAKPIPGRQLGDGRLALVAGHPEMGIQFIELAFRTDGGAGDYDGEALARLNLFLSDWRYPLLVADLERRRDALATAADRAAARLSKASIRHPRAWARQAADSAAAQAFRACQALDDARRPGGLHTIDPRLFDLVSEMQMRAGGPRRPFVVQSGYRSPITNAVVGGAEQSQHLEGKAVDLSFDGLALDDATRMAIALDQGGVGTYPAANFLHVDVGPRFSLITGERRVWSQTNHTSKARA